MTIERSKDLWNGNQRWVVTITPRDYDSAKFGSGDYLLMAECGKDTATIADQLLALELIARRIEEAQKAAA